MNKLTERIYLLLILAAVLLLLAILVEKRARKKKGDVKTAYTKTHRGFSETLCDVLILIPGVRGIVKRLEARLRPFYATPKKNTYSREYRKVIGRMMAICFLAIIFCILVIFVINPSVYTFAVSVFIAYSLSVTIVRNRLMKIETEFLKGTSTFLGNVVHQFYRIPSPKEATFHAMSGLSANVRDCVGEICGVLDSDDVEVARKAYVASPHNEFLKLYLSFAERVEEEGNPEDVNGKPVFITSAMKLREDVEDEKRYLIAKAHQFRGLSLTAAIPVIAVSYIATWGTDTLPQMAEFYVGRFGSLIKVAILLLSLISFNMINTVYGDYVTGLKTYPLLTKLAGMFPFLPIVNLLIAKDGKEANVRADKLKKMGEHYGIRTLYFMKILAFAGALVVTFAVLSYGHAQRREFLLHDTDMIDSVSDVADGAQINAMKRVIPQYTQLYVKAGELPQEEELVQIVFGEAGIRTEEVARDSTDEIIRRCNEYEREFFDPIDVIIVLVCSILALMYPTLNLDIRAIVIESKIQTEINRFQSLIYMLSRVPGMTTSRLLEAMEGFSVIFKRSIQRCINEISIDEHEAIERMRNSETNLEFKKISDGFLLVEEVGMENAFVEIGDEINNFRLDRKLERTNLLDDEVLLATLFAVLPGGIILFGYLLIPFMVKAMGMFDSYMGQLQSMANF